MGRLLEDRDPSLIRFSGTLTETMDFALSWGWETRRVLDNPGRGDGRYRLDVLAASGDALSSFSPRVDFRREGDLAVANVVAYVPLPPGAVEIVFMRVEPSERLLARAPLAAQPPRVAITTQEVGERSVRLAWAADHEQPLRYTVMYLRDDGPPLTLAFAVEDQRITVPLADLPGSPAGRLAVLASDGLRSAVVESEPFAVPETPPTVVVMQPREDAGHPPDNPLSLLGMAHDPGGFELPDEGLVWSVDGREVGRGSRVAASAALEPGLHEVELRYAGSDSVARLAVRVAERTEDDEALRRLLEQYPPPLPGSPG